MAILDQADFVITETGIHGGPLAWKLGTSEADPRAPAKIFSIRDFRLTPAVANRDEAPAEISANPEPIDYNRSDFGDLRPVSHSPDDVG